MKIGNRKIGEDYAPFIVAEMSGNHNKSLPRALEITEAAAKAGAHALKLQTYTADTITLNIDTKDFLIDDPQSPWNGRRLYDLYQEASTPWDWHKPIFRRAAELGMICFSSPFDESAVDFLEDINSPAYKIASFENNHYPLIKKVVETGKPLFLSTGLASLEELVELVDFLQKESCSNFVLLKCTSVYPARSCDCNLKTMVDMKNHFKCEVGFSDHAPGIGAAVGAVALGACVIEKHFTIRRADGGPDASFSLEPDEMVALVRETNRAFEALGKTHYGPTALEQSSLGFRRSIYISEDIERNEELTEHNVRIVRPGFGLEPKHIYRVLGRRAKKNLTIGEPLKWSDIE